MKKILRIITLFIILFLVMCIGINNKSSANNTGLQHNNGLYIWNLTDLDYSASKLLIDYLDVDTVHIGNYSNLHSYKNNLYTEFAKANNLKTYVVFGEKYEDQDKVLAKIKSLVDKVYEYNLNSDYKISGLTIDSEFHATNVYKNAELDEKIAIFDKYVRIMKEAHEYANSKGLEYIACIPWNYDSKLSVDLVDELFKDGCDSVQIMNYTKSKSIVNIEKEIELAQKYNKKIESLAQLQAPTESIPETTTFWNNGIDACTNRFKEIEDTYNYENLYFTYHHLVPMLNLFKDNVDYSNLYDYKLYPKNEDDESLAVDDLYLVNGNERIKGLKVFDSDNNKNVVYFYGVSYDKEYTLELGNTTYSIPENKVKFNKDVNRIITGEKIFTDYVEEPTTPQNPTEPETPITPTEPTTPVNSLKPVEPTEPIVIEKPDNTVSEDKTSEVIESKENGNPQNGSTSPKTGDNINFYIEMFIIGLAGIIIIISIIIIRKKHNKK